MLRKERVPDKTILKNVNRRLQRTGLGARCRIATAVRNGQVTLSGNIQYEAQRRPVLRAVNGVDGIRGVVDQVQVQSRDGYR
jgi:osmotically-inducible protein OsmY